MDRLTPEQVNTLYPISGLEVYKGALRVLRSSSFQHRPGKKKKGQNISYLSRKSLNNFAFLVSTTEVRFLSLLTLTYGENYPKNGRTVKADLTRILTWIKRHMPTVQYFWFLEFQSRGAPHFHVGLSLAYPGEEMQGLLARSWARISNRNEGVYCGVGTGNNLELGGVCPGCGSVRLDVEAQHRREGVWENVRSMDGSIRYVLSYALKPYQKRIPAVYRNVGRFWGVSGDVKPGRFARFYANEVEVREFAASLGRSFDEFEVLPKYLFHSGNLTKSIEEIMIL
jgi:hypothetical protein